MIWPPIWVLYHNCEEFVNKAVKVVCSCSDVIIDKDDMTYIFLKELFVESDEQEDAVEFAFKLEYEDGNQKK
jgi:hypothetical protein